METFHAGSSLVGEVFFALCKAVDTPFSLGAWIRFRDDVSSFTELSINPKDYDSADLFKMDYLICSFLAKYQGLSTGINLKEVALQKFKTSEEQCLATNRRLRKHRQLPLNPGIEAVIHSAKRKIASVLGVFDRSKIRESYGWGPGSTSSIPRRKAFVDFKVSELPISVTRRALPLLREEIASDLHWSSVILGVDISDINGSFCFLPGVFLVTEECVIDTVTKNSKTDRVIAKEPTGNGFLQKGFGAFISRRLKSVGVDLHNQENNQRGALLAQSLALATLDLKAASDTVSIEVIYDLFPVEWAIALDDVRSHNALMPNGEILQLEKFSSMGNGFTFEVESLIFWALSSACSDLSSDGESVLVYGDDIIVPQRCAQLLIEVLSHFGFTINDEKSFVEGNFFESCGKHYFAGEDVTPIYQKETVHDFKSLIRLGNRLMRFAHRSMHHSGLDQRLHGAWARVWRAAGESSAYQLPLGTEGDDGWLLPARYFGIRPHDANLGIRCRIWRSPQSRFPANEAALLAWTLRRGVATDQPFEGSVTASSDTTVTGGRWVMPTWEFGLDW